MRIEQVPSTSIERGWVVQTVNRLLLVVDVSTPKAEHRTLLRCVDSMGNGRSLQFDPQEQVEVCIP